MKRSNIRIAVVALVVLALAVAVRFLLRGGPFAEREGHGAVASEAPAQPRSASELADGAGASATRTALETDMLAEATESAVPPNSLPSAARSRSGSGTLVGRVLFDGGVLASDLRVTPRTTTVVDGRTITSHFAFEELDAEGRYRIEGLEPGTVEVHIVEPQVLAEGPEPVFVAAEVVADVTTELPDIDLRGRLFVHELTVLDETGQAVPKGLGTYEHEGWNIGVDVADGRARVVTTERQVDLWLGGPGRRCIRVVGVDGPRAVVLGPALPVHVRLLDPVVLSDEIEVRVRLRSYAGATNAVLGDIASSLSVPFAPDGTATPLAPSDGDYVVDVTVVRRSDGRMGRVEFSPPLTVAVVEAQGSPFVDVPLTRAQLDAVR